MKRKWDMKYVMGLAHEYRRREPTLPWSDCLKRSWSTAKEIRAFAVRQFDDVTLDAARASSQRGQGRPSCFGQQRPSRRGTPAIGTLPL